MKKFIYSTILCALLISGFTYSQSFTKITSGAIANDSGWCYGCCWADFNNDGYQDLFVVNNMAGNKNNLLYMNNGNGTFTKVTTGPVVNDGGSSYGCTAADYDNDGLDTLNDSMQCHERSLFYLSRTPIQRILQVKVNNIIIQPNNYCYNLENGWISFSAVYPYYATLSVKYIASHDLDFAVSNWDPTNGNYIFKNNISVNINNISSSLPDKFELQQNFPNPFNPSTKIRFSLSEKGFTSLKVFDIIGREIRSLVNKNLESGTYEVEFDASNLASGIYFYNIIVNDFSYTRKMILSK